MLPLTTSNAAHLPHQAHSALSFAGLESPARASLVNLGLRRFPSYRKPHACPRRQESKALKKKRAPVQSSFSFFYKFANLEPPQIITHPLDCTPEPSVRISSTRFTCWKKPRRHQRLLRCAKQDPDLPCLDLNTKHTINLCQFPTDSHRRPERGDLNIGDIGCTRKELPTTPAQNPQTEVAKELDQKSSHKNRQQ